MLINLVLFVLLAVAVLGGASVDINFQDGVNIGEAVAYVIRLLWRLVVWLVGSAWWLVDPFAMQRQLLAMLPVVLRWCYYLGVVAFFVGCFVRARPLGMRSALGKALLAWGGGLAALRLATALPYALYCGAVGGCASAADGALAVAGSGGSSSRVPGLFARLWHRLAGFLHARGATALGASLPLLLFLAAQWWTGAALLAAHGRVGRGLRELGGRLDREAANAAERRAGAGNGGNGAGGNGGGGNGGGGNGGGGTAGALLRQRGGHAGGAGMRGGADGPSGGRPLESHLDSNRTAPSAASAGSYASPDGAAVPPPCAPPLYAFALRAGAPLLLASAALAAARHDFAPLFPPLAALPYALLAAPALAFLAAVAALGVVAAVAALHAGLHFWPRAAVHRLAPWGAGVLGPAGGDAGRGGAPAEGRLAWGLCTPGGAFVAAAPVWWGALPRDGSVNALAGM